MIEKPKQEKFIRIIQSAGIELYDELMSGRIINVYLTDDDMTWNLNLEFDNILPLNIILDLKEKLSQIIFPCVPFPDP